LVLLGIGAIIPPAGAGSAGYFDAGDWFVRREGGPSPGCTLGTGGYDRVTERHEPILTVTVRPGGDISVTANAASTLGLDALRRMDLRLRVEGPQALSVPAVPSAITETRYERSISLRPHFAAGDRRRRMRGLIDAMQAGDTLIVELGGRALEPAFSLRGFSAVWDRAARWCGVED